MLNYLVQDRPGLSFASKEVSGDMVKPTQMDMVKLNHIIRYFSQARRRCIKVSMAEPDELRVSIDSDIKLAGCIRSRESTCDGT